MPKINIISARRLVFSVVFFSFAFGLGYGIGIKGFVLGLNQFPHVKISREVPEKDLDFSLFWNVWDDINSSYFDKSKLVPAKMVYGAISGMVAAIGDPYTVFLPPSQNKVAEDDLKGNFDGVGIQIGFRGTNLAVIAPLPASPAERAGIKAGDLILGIKDEKKGIDVSTAGISLPDAVQMIRGPSGSIVTLTLGREGHDKPIISDIVRETIDVPSVMLAYEGDSKDIAVLKLLKFGDDTRSEWDKAVSEISLKTNLKGIVLDLRNNPGGRLQGAVDIASDFVGPNKTIVIEEDGNGNKEEVKSQLVGRLINQNVVVLVNKGSASASEILAGALRDIRGIKIVGDSTFGKGTVQEPQQLENGAGLHVTIAKWLTPSGVWVNDKGLEPDVKVKESDDSKKDDQLLKAIELLS